VAIEKLSTVPMKTARRPMRSAKRPHTAAPRIAPIPDDSKIIAD
jgi:hypothetical protein